MCASLGHNSPNGTVIVESWKIPENVLTLVCSSKQVPSVVPQQRAFCNRMFELPV